MGIRARGFVIFFFLIFHHDDTLAIHSNFLLAIFLLTVDLQKKLLVLEQRWWFASEKADIIKTINALSSLWCRLTDQRTTAHREDVSNGTCESLAEYTVDEWCWQVDCSPSYSGRSALSTKNGKYV